MNNSQIVIIYQAIGKTPELKKIENSVCEFEKMLGGKINVIPYKDIAIVCKEDRKNLRPNIYINTKFLSIGESVRGDILIVSREEQNFKSLTKKQAIKYIGFLENASFHYDNANLKSKSVLSSDQAFIKRLEKERCLNSNEKKDSDEVLNMILAIQTIILKFIKNNEN